MRLIVFYSFLVFCLWVSNSSIVRADNGKSTDFKLESISSEDTSPELQEMREWGSVAE